MKIRELIKDYFEEDVVIWVEKNVEAEKLDADFTGHSKQIEACLPADKDVDICFQEMCDDLGIVNETYEELKAEYFQQEEE